MSIRRNPDAQRNTLDEILGIDFDRLRTEAAPATDDRRDGAGAAVDRTSASATVFDPDDDHRIHELSCSVPATFDGDGNPETRGSSSPTSTRLNNAPRPRISSFIPRSSRVSWWTRAIRST